jgi:hypothetical protein
MKSTVHILGIHVPGQKIVLTSESDGGLEKIDIQSLLEKYFGRPIDSLHDHLTYVDDRPASCDVDKNVCEPVRFANPRINSAICILRSVHPRMHEVFALRPLL